MINKGGIIFKLYTIRMNRTNNRVFIGSIHNEGEGKTPKREWFGVGKRGKKKLNRVVKKLLHEKLRLRK